MRMEEESATEGGLVGGRRGPPLSGGGDRSAGAVEEPATMAGVAPKSPCTGRCWGDSIPLEVAGLTS